MDRRIGSDAGILVDDGFGGRPVRPGVPAVLPLALTFWAACAGAYTQLEACPEDAGVVLLAGAGAASVMLVFVVVKTRAALSGCVALGLALGLACAGAGAWRVHADVHLEELPSMLWTFTLEQDASAGSYGSSAVARARSEAGDEARVCLRFEAQADLLCGDAVSCRTSLDAAEGSSRAFGWTRGTVLLAQIPSDADIHENAGPLSAVRKLRREALDSFAAYAGEEASILQALVCGWRGGMDSTGEYEDYKTVGLAHIVAVSGSHLVVVCAMFMWLLKLLRVGALPRAAVSVFFVVAYLVFSGLPVSALRAGFMAVVSLVGTSVAHRRGAALSSLSICALVFVALDPSASVSASFFLSAASTLGIVCFGGLFASWLGGKAHAACRAVAEPCALTLSSAVAVQPFSCALFSQLPLLSLPANIVAGPLFSLGCVAGLTCCLVGAFLPGTAEVLMPVAGMAACPLSAAVESLARMPYACIAVDFPVVPALAVSGLACLALWVAWPRLTLRHVLGGAGTLALLSVCLSIIVVLLRGPQIVMLDVGQGDAILVRDGPQALLIDTGNQDGMLRQALGRQGVQRLDGVLVTHPDDDHCGSLEALAGVCEVDAVYVADGVTSCPCDACAELRERIGAVFDREPEGLRVGDELRIGDFALEVIWPCTLADEGGNADSVCLYTTLHADDETTSWTALFCGDAEADQVSEACERAGVGRIDVLKVGHHGARVALDEELVARLSPTAALLSVGEGNRYGHPAKETVERLEGAGAAILRTDEHGDVALSFSKEGIRVAFEREGDEADIQ